jgi:hypothetical protein
MRQELRHVSLVIAVTTVLAVVRPATEQDPTATGSGAKTVRIGGNPILMLASSPTLGDNLNAPSLIRTPAWLQQPPGRYDMYFGQHHGAFIRLAYAVRLTGFWTVYEPGPLELDSVRSCRDRVSSPDVHMDNAHRGIRMCVHSLVANASNNRQDAFGQDVFVAVSIDGLCFRAARRRSGRSTSGYSSGEATRSPGGLYSVAGESAIAMTGLR